MEILTTPPPVPLPPNASPTIGFHKSKVILILSYIQLGLFVFNFFWRSSMGSFSMSYFSMLSPISILFILPAILIIFTKNNFVYRIARIFLILEYVFIPVALIGILIAFILAW